MMYKLPDRITDMLALCGMWWFMGTAWRGLEVWLYGTSQESAVDSVVGVVICVLVVFSLRLWSVFVHDGSDPL